MRRFLIAAALLPAALWGKWTEYKSGPFHVFSASGDRVARERLTQLEQLRFVLGTMLAKSDLQTVWPIDVVLSPGKQAPGFVPGGAATLIAAPSDGPFDPEVLRGVARILIEDNTGRMPAGVEAGLADLLSTIQVNVTKVSIGARPPDLPPARVDAWTRIQLLATSPDYSGKVRVFFSTMQQGLDEPSALKNAFGLTPGTLSDRLKTSSGSVTPVTGKALNPDKDFIEKTVPDGDMNQLLDELRSEGKNVSPETARGLAAKGTRAALELAVAANPKWSEPHVKLADLETVTSARVPHLKQAAALAPRDYALWQRLAEAQTAAAQYDDALKSWAAAEKAAPDDSTRARIHVARLANEEQRSEFNENERRRIADERAKELERLKAQAIAEIHAAERAADEATGPRVSKEAAVAWWSDAKGTKLEGQITRVDCLSGAMMRLAVQSAAGPPTPVLIRDSSKLAVHGAESVEFACGAQRPPIEVLLFYDAKPDARQGTVGDVTTIEVSR